MAEVKAPVSASKDALAAIFGKGSDKAQVGSEPPSGLQGKGTADEPYDQGNAPAQGSNQAQEPPAGVAGKGTADEPYDQGNGPEQAATTLTNNSKPVALSTETHQGSGLPEAEPNATETAAIQKSKSHLESVMGVKKDGAKPTPTPSINEPDASSTSTPPTKATVKTAEPNDAKRGRKEWPSTRAGQNERSVSPGTLDDGSHVMTSGDKGEGYQPQTKLGKLKDKVFGAH